MTSAPGDWTHSATEAKALYLAKRVVKPDALLRRFAGYPHHTGAFLWTHAVRRVAGGGKTEGSYLGYNSARIGSYGWTW